MGLINKGENVRLAEIGPWEQEGDFSWENWTFSRGREIVEENLITGKIAINRISSITGISIHKLKKYKKRL